MIEPVSLEYAGALSSWLSMMQRCLIPTHSGFVNYGKRGIRICDRWRDFTVFLEDLGPRPEGFSLERDNPNGNYEPSNCRWVLLQSQSRNTRRTVHIGNGDIRADVARKAGVTDGAIGHRLAKGESGDELYRTKGTRGLKLWRTDVDQIRALKVSGTPTKVIAVQFKVSRQTINAILSGKTWA